jgi:hypothetical protein
VECEESRRRDLVHLRNTIYSDSRTYTFLRGGCVLLALVGGLFYSISDHLSWLFVAVVSLLLTAQFSIWIRLARIRVRSCDEMIAGQEVPK